MDKATIPQTPHRQIETKIEISADDNESLVNALERLLFDARQGKFPISSVSGGYSWGWMIATEIDKSQTHDSFVEQLNEFLGKGERL